MIKLKRRKLELAGLIMCLAASICGGCGTGNTSSSKYYMNASYDETLKDLNGENHTFDNTEKSGIVSETAGIAIDYTETMKELMDKQSLFVSDLDNMGYMFVYMPVDSNAGEIADSESGTLSDEITDTETTNEYISSDSAEDESDVYYYMAVYSVPNTTDEEIEANLSMMKESFDKIEEIGSADGRNYYLATNSSTSDLNYSSDDLDNIKELVKDLDNIKNQICIFKVGDEDTENIGDFKGTSSAGEDVTNEIFSDYDITMINIWSTNCEPCKEEMPELEKLSKKLPENANFISVCVDGANDTELTQSILNDLGCSFQVVYPGKNLTSFIQDNYQFVPTTIFVDKDGNIVGSAITGVPSGDDVVQSYLDAIQNRLDSLSE